MSAALQFSTAEEIELNTPEHFDARRTGIGGSDIAAVLGTSPYKSAYEVYEEKVNGFKQDLSDNEKVLWGNLLEEPIAKRYGQVTGKKLSITNLIRSGDYPFLIASPDRLVLNERQGLEIKAVGEHTKHLWGENGSQLIPEYYYLQVAHYMLVLDYQAWDVAALIGGQELRIYTFERDREIDDLIVQGAFDFWTNHVQKKIAPPKDYTRPDVQQLIKRKNNLVSDVSVELTDEYVGITDKLENAKEQIKRYQLLQKEAEAELLDAIGEAGKAVLPDGRTFYRKKIERKAYQVEASSYITLSLKKGV